MDRIGLSGPHKSGKTTLAKAYARRWNLDYVDMNIRGVLKSFGVSPNEELNFPRRLEIQENLVSHFHNMLSYRNRSYITDRTYMDIAAMTLSFMPHTITALEGESVAAHLNRCYDGQSQLFNNLIVMGNAFEPPVDTSNPHKATYNWAWNFQIEALIKGLVLNQHNHCITNFLTDKYDTVEKRLERLDSLLERDTSVTH